MGLEDCSQEYETKFPRNMLVKLSWFCGANLPQFMLLFTFHMLKSQKLGCL